MDDLSDADLRLRPVEGMHPIALQLGHLIVAEQMFNNMIKPGSAPALPDGFKEAHDFKNKELTDAGFVEQRQIPRAAGGSAEPPRKAVLDGLPDSDLDDTRDGKLPPFASDGRSSLAHGRHALPESFRSVRGGAANAQEADRVLKRLPRRDSGRDSSRAQRFESRPESRSSSTG